MIGLVDECYGRPMICGRNGAKVLFLYNAVDSILRYQKLAERPPWDSEVIGMMGNASSNSPKTVNNRSSMVAAFRWIQERWVGACSFVSIRAAASLAENIAECGEATFSVVNRQVRIDTHPMIIVPEWQADAARIIGWVKFSGGVASLPGDFWHRGFFSSNAKRLGNRGAGQPFGYEALIKEFTRA